MVNVFVAGTSSISHALVQSLTRSGNHRVFCLAGDPNRDRGLATSEAIIIPVDDSFRTSPLETMRCAFSTYSIDVVVDLLRTLDTYCLFTLCKHFGAVRLKKASEAKIRVPKVGYIYYSDTGVHGSSTDPVNDLMPVGLGPNAPNPPTNASTWRIGHEKVVLASSDILDVMILRPGRLYGYASYQWSDLFQTILDAKNGGADSTFPQANMESRPALVHIADVVSGIHCAVDKLPLISGTGVYPVFDLVTSQEGMFEILMAVARAFGYSGSVCPCGSQEDNEHSQAMSCSLNATSARAKTILGWEPRKIGFVQHMDIYVKAWCAGQGM